MTTKIGMALFFMKFSALAALEAVKMTTSGVTTDKNMWWVDIKFLFIGNIGYGFKLDHWGKTVNLSLCPLAL